MFWNKTYSKEVKKMAYEVKVIPKIGTPTKATVRDKIAVCEFIERNYSFGIWNDDVKIEIKKIPDLKK